MVKKKNSEKGGTWPGLERTNRIWKYTEEGQVFKDLGMEAVWIRQAARMFIGNVG